MSTDPLAEEKKRGEEHVRWMLAERSQREKRRRATLSQMSRTELNGLADEYLLPTDLGRAEKIKYILKKEFPSR